jgi:glycosyltransferase involved in cell wall biosynthesis
MPPLAKYSVVLCTHNQCESLKIVLECLAGQVVSDPDLVEVIVVDNNSTDATREVVEAWSEKSPRRRRYVFEGTQGLSVARNRGVEEAAGEVIIFTDDDARIPSGWLQAYVDTYEQYRADCVFGKITIEWDRPKPFWYADHLRSMFVGLDYGDSVLRVQDNAHEFFGKNFAVRKSLIEEFGGFDSRLGRVGDKLYVGEETVIYKRLIAAGKTVIYNPDIELGHMLKPHEYTIEHFAKYHNDVTLSHYRLHKAAGGKKLLSRPLYPLSGALMRLARTPYDLVRAVVGSDLRGRLYARLEVKRALRTIYLWMTNEG